MRVFLCLLTGDRPLAGTSLLTLIDDIAALLDDIAMMSKLSARKTAGVLGDDLALNAEQVSGVRADRELPVVWAVAKGSFKNKLILVPAALVLLVGLVRGAPESSGPEASLLAALAFGHLTAACMSALVATERYHMLLTHHLDLEVVAFRGPAGALAIIATIGIAAAAATGVTSTRGRTFGGLAGLASLGLWAPLALLGPLPQLG